MATGTLVVRSRKWFAAGYAIDMTRGTGIHQGVRMGIMLRHVRAGDRMTIGAGGSLRMAVGAALSSQFGIGNMFGMHGGAIRDIAARPAAVVAVCALTVGHRQRIAAGHAIDMAIGAGYAVGVPVMILGTGSDDIQAVIGGGPVDGQRIPHGLFKRMTENAVRPGSLGNMADRTVFLDIPRFLQMHSVLWILEYVEGMAPGAFAPRFNRDRSMALTLA